MARKPRRSRVGPASQRRAYALVWVLIILIALSLTFFPLASPSGKFFVPGQDQYHLILQVAEGPAGLSVMKKDSHFLNSPGQWVPRSHTALASLVPVAANDNPGEIVVLSKEAPWLPLACLEGSCYNLHFGKTPEGPLAFYVQEASGADFTGALVSFQSPSSTDIPSSYSNDVGSSDVSFDDLWEDLQNDYYGALISGLPQPWWIEPPGPRLGPPGGEEAEDLLDDAFGLDSEGFDDLDLDDDLGEEDLGDGWEEEGSGGLGVDVSVTLWESDSGHTQLSLDIDLGPAQEGGPSVLITLTASGGS